MNKRQSEKFFNKLLDDDFNMPDDDETKKAFNKGAFLVCLDKKIEETKFEAQCNDCGCKVYYGDKKGNPKKFMCNRCFEKILDEDKKIEINIPVSTAEKIAELAEKKERAIAG